MKTPGLTALSLLLAATTLLAAPAGALDPSFNPPRIERNGPINAMVLQADGKVVVGGNFTSVSGIPRTNVARINLDGSVDTSFETTSITNILMNPWQVTSMAQQPDGRIVVGFGTVFSQLVGPGNNPRPSFVARLDTNGFVELEFKATNSSASSPFVYSLSVRQNGNILMGGASLGFQSLREVMGTTGQQIGRSFNGFNSAATTVYALAPTTDGGFYTAGRGFTNPPSTGVGPTIVRYSANGALDTRFVAPRIFSGTSGSVKSLAVQSDDKVIVAGNFHTVEGVPTGNIVRLNSDGSVDSGFLAGTGATGPINTVIVQPDGRILIGGAFVRYNGQAVTNLARLNADGTLDSSFQATAHGTVSSLVSGPEHLFIAGDLSAVNASARASLAKMSLSPETLDANYVPWFLASAMLKAVAVLPDRHIVIGGNFAFVNGASRRGVAMLDEDGSVTASFDSSNGIDSLVETVAATPDGKIVVGGDFDRYQGEPRSQIVRILATGEVDPTFVPPGDYSSRFSVILAVAVAPAGKVVPAGYWLPTANARPRLNADGSVDETFRVGFNSSGVSTIYTVAVQPDGKVIYGGSFFLISPTSPTGYVRVNSDGSRDSTFATATPSTMRASVIQPDGRIILGGYSGLDPFGGPARVARLNTNGTTDGTFQFSSTLLKSFSEIRALAVESSGNVVVGADTSLLRLSPNGSLDSTFDPIWRTNASVASLTLDASGRLLAAGTFVIPRSTNRLALVRLLGDTPPVALELQASISGESFALTFETSVGVTYVVEFKDDLGASSWTIAQTITGDGAMQTSTTMLSASTQRFFRVRTQQ